MSIKSRIISSVLIPLLILPSCAVFSSCGSESSENTPAEEQTTTAAEALPGEISSDDSIPEETAAPEKAESVHLAEDFNGENISFLLFSNSPYQSSVLDLVADSYDGRVINDAVFERNNILMEKYNINFTFEDKGTRDETEKLLKNLVKAGDATYDVAFLCADKTATLGIDGNLLNVNTLPNLQTKEAWWNQKLLDSSSVFGINYFLVGDMNIDTWTQSYVIFFNKMLAQGYEVPDLYTTVLDGRWTMDTLDTLTRMVYKDTNGDGTYDPGDTYGLSACSVCIDCFWSSADVNFVTADENGMTLQYTEAFYTLWEKMVNLLNAPEMLYTDRPQYKSNRCVYDRAAFLEDRALFFVEAFCVADDQLRDMESDFGILPLPKADEQQTDYRTFSHTAHNSTVSFPITSESRIDMLTKVIDDMAFYSTDTVRPAYYEKVLSGKIARDENSTAMLDILTENVIYDRAFLFLFNAMLGMRDQITNSNPAASYAAKNQKQLQKTLDSYTEKIKEQIH